MKSTNFNNLTIYQFQQFSLLNEITHFVSTRQGGVSQGNCSSLNLGYNTNDLAENVQKNREILAKTFSTSFNFPQQTHKNHVQIVTKDNHSTFFEDTDALITNEPTLGIAVLFADCVPVLVYDPEKKVVAVIHAGWRGTVAKIVEKTIEKMVAVFNCNPTNILAGIGPSISPHVYEVGTEVIVEVEKAFGSKTPFITNEQENGKAHLNLWECNKQCLLNTGVLEKNIQIAGICTQKNADTFFSVRANADTGRFALGVFINHQD